eukprot:TRINITY_DN7308_c0_g1_i2.p1 TRINITY_DN7308_c0_g1~~TRINITY_DN7308_c0_g1_i2.p1  ORF type:complete len:187 (+),score=43.90 TRINITY_DN7308_c0_g1_i2:76-561(+)
MEGTRLTLQANAPEGFEFSIRTPGTPHRWVEYNKEISSVWNFLLKEATSEPSDFSKIRDYILTLTFYWYNFMPLSRGTAAVGYMSLLAMFLSFDYEVTSNIIPDHQPDWEGILSPKPEMFISAISAWLYPSLKKTDLLDRLPSMEQTFPTLRSMVEALNVK